MFISKRLVLAHFWLAFIAFGVALLLGAWQMFVRSTLHPWLRNPEGALLSLGHGVRHGHGLCVSHAHCDGLRLRGQRALH